MGAAEGARRLASAQRVRAFSFVVLAAASWGIGTVLSKRAVAELPPLTLLAAQLLVSVAILSIALRWTHQPIRGTDRRLALLGALYPGLAYALSLIGLTMISASASVLIWAIEPILILLLAAHRSRRAPGPAIAALSFLAFAGLIVAVGAQAAARPGRRRAQPRRGALLRRLQRRRPAMDRGLPVDARRRDVPADRRARRRGARRLLVAASVAGRSRRRR